MKRQGSGRKAVDGITGADKRVNVVLTSEHRRRLEQLAPNGFSAWIRAAIDTAWGKQRKDAPNA
jgi:hypothetical protein